MLKEKVKHLKLSRNVYFSISVTSENFYFIPRSFN